MEEASAERARAVRVVASRMLAHEPRDQGPLRVCLFTDTLGDVNGVSRFIRTIGQTALERGDRLDVITSTRFECPQAPNVWNIPSRYARPMPGYSTLEVVWPDARALERCAEALKPDVVHVSTPGPVGMVGRRFALRRGLPLVGTYHTDFPAYVAHLFDDAALTWVCGAAMRRFYAPFARVFTRSAEYARAMEGVGIGASRVERLVPGIDVRAFDAGLRDERGGVWAGIAGARAESVKALYVGRVSVEKNLPMLARHWPRIAAACRGCGVDAQLIVVGDGPYRAEMERALTGHDAVFAGFRHGQELATVYASSHVFVFPSTTDTLGQVVMEAQCAGLPVVVTDKGGPREVTRDGVTGVVASGERAWGDAAARLLVDAPLRTRMGAAARAAVLPMSIEHSFAHFWSVHEAVCIAHKATHKESPAWKPSAGTGPDIGDA